MQAIPENIITGNPFMEFTAAGATPDQRNLGFQKICLSFDLSAPLAHP